MGSYWDSIKPWDCGHCGKLRISANKTDCPKCHTPRPGSAAAQARAAQEQIGQATREYEGEKAMVSGIAEMAAQGWKVQSQTSYQPRAGAGRVALLGIGAAVIKPQMRFVVIYTR